MPKSIPEPDAELLSAEDVQSDVLNLTEALEKRKRERLSYDILAKPPVKEMLDKLVASGVCGSEEEAIERALKTLMTAVNL
jgi:hypothetical protein